MYRCTGETRSGTAAPMATSSDAVIPLAGEVLLSRVLSHCQNQRRKKKKKYLHDSVLADEFTTANKLNTIAHSGKICACALVEDSVTRRCR